MSWDFIISLIFILRPRITLFRGEPTTRIWSSCGLSVIWSQISRCSCNGSHIGDYVLTQSGISLEKASGDWEVGSWLWNKDASLRNLTLYGVYDLELGDWMCLSRCNLYCDCNSYFDHWGPTLLAVPQSENIRYWGLRIWCMVPYIEKLTTTLFTLNDRIWLQIRFCCPGLYLFSTYYGDIHN